MMRLTLRPEQTKRIARKVKMVKIIMLVLTMPLVFFAGQYLTGQDGARAKYALFGLGFSTLPFSFLAIFLFPIAVQRVEEKRAA